MKRRLQPGVGGFARQGVDPSEAYYLENLRIDKDGCYVPRFGLKHIKTMSGAITHLSKMGGYNAKLMVVSNSGSLDELHVETGTLVNAGSGWPTTPISTTLGPNTAGDNRWIGCKSAIGGSVGTLYSWDGATLTALSADMGNWVETHADFVVRVASGDTTSTAIEWSALGDLTTWTAARKRKPLPKMGTVDAIVSFSDSESILVGPYGFGRLLGRDPDNLSWAMLDNGVILTPMHHVCKCKDRIMLFAGGPAILEYIPPGTVRRIEMPIYRDLFLASGLSNIRTWYDPIRNYYCVSDRTQHITYCYDIERGKWVGLWTYTTTSTDLLGTATIDQGASTTDAATQPWAKGFLAAGSLVLQWDPSVYTDATASNATAAFTCSIETQPSSDPDPRMLKQLNGVDVDGSGTWTVSYRYRNAPGGSWTTVSDGAWTVAAPGRFDFPPSENVYREFVVRLSGSSSSSLKFRSLEVDVDVVGDGD